MLSDYVEANLLATPEFSRDAGDVLFVIGTFPWLFGHARGDQLRSWALARGFVLVWGLGPERCYERVNQTGGTCDPGHWSPHLGSGEPAYLANGRLLDPKVRLPTLDTLDACLFLPSCVSMSHCASYR